MRPLPLLFLCVALTVNFAASFATGQDFDELLDDLVPEEEQGSTQVEGQEEIELHGVVLEQRKYSILVQSGLKSFEIKLPIGVPIQRELIRPNFDFANSKVTMTLPCSSADGNQSGNEVVNLDLPETVYIKAEFKSESEKLEFLSNNRSLLVNRFCLFKSPPINLKDNEVVGTLKSQAEEMFIEVDGTSHPVELGTKSNLFSGFSVLDLQEGAEVSVIALKDENSWVAQDVRFQLLNTTEVKTAESKRLLSLGDMISFSYQRALHEQFSDQYSVTHPPANCGSTTNWPLLNRWLGSYVDQKWDIILFNSGMLDHSMSKEQYQTNLRNWITTIEPAGNQLVWLMSTPIPGKNTGPTSLGGEYLTGKVPGRMKLQNQWAAEVLIEYPTIQVCDLWQVIKEDESGEFKEWWQGNRPQFNYRQSKVIAAAIESTMNQK